MKVLLFILLFTLPLSGQFREKQETIKWLDIPLPQESNRWKIFTGAGILLVANYADYFYQADIHGWNNPLWVNGTRAPKWGIFDFLPHDGWHICQTISRAGLVYGSILIWEGMEEYDWYWKLLAVVGVNALTRGIGFSATYKVLK